MITEGVTPVAVVLSLFLSVVYRKLHILISKNFVRPAPQLMGVSCLKLRKVILLHIFQRISSGFIWDKYLEGSMWRRMCRLRAD